MKSIGIIVALCTALFSLQIEASDLEVKITEAKTFASVMHGVEQITVQRIQDTSHVIDDSFAKTSRPCPPFCISPIDISDGVKTIAEIEVIDFMETDYTSGKGTIIDARDASWYQRGTIPGSINLPAAVFERNIDDPELVELLESLGAREREKIGAIQRVIESLGFFDGDMKTDQWDFTEAKTLLIWCNGPWGAESPSAIHALVKIGYPNEKLRYYRGGMQMWQSLGLTTVIPKLNSRVASK